MSHRPDNHHRAPRRGRPGAGAGTGAGRQGVELVAVDPAIITAEEAAAAAEFAARDAADLDAEWAALSDADRDALACGEDEYDDGHVIVPPDPFTPDTTDHDTTDHDSDDTDDDTTDRATTTGARWWEAEWLSLAAEGAVGATVWELLAAATAEPGSLGVPDRPDQPGGSLHQLQCLDRLMAQLAGHRHGLVAAMCPVDDGLAGYRFEQHLVDEIATATRVGPGTAARAIDSARLLAGPFTASREDLLDGVITDAHVRVLTWETRNVTDDPRPVPASDCPDCTNTTDTNTSTSSADTSTAEVRRLREEKLAEIQTQVASYARTQTPIRFATTVRAAICAVDPEGEADRHAAAKKARDVTTSRDTDGMGTLVGRDDAATVDAIHAVLTDAAKALQAQRGGTAAARAGDPDARIGACRADVLAALVLGPDHASPNSSDGAGNDNSGSDPGSRTRGPGRVEAGAGPVDVGGPPAPGVGWVAVDRSRTGRVLATEGPGSGGSAGHRPGHPAPGSRQSVPANGPPLGERSESSRGGNVIPALVARALAASVKAWPLGPRCERSEQ